MSGNKIVLKGGIKQLRPIITQILAINKMLQDKDIGTFYIDPDETPRTRRRGHPKVVLFFLEDSAQWQERCRLAEKKISRGRGEISFRLMGFNSSTISKSKLLSIGELIKSQFGGNGGYVWEKGKTLYSYADWDNGYQFQILSRTKTQAKQLATKVLHLNEHIFDNTKFNIVQPEEPLLKYPAKPPSIFFLGNSVQQQEQRPLVSVRFQYAQCHIDCLAYPVCLYALSNRKKKLLVS